MKEKVIKIVINILLILLLFYFKLPALNLSDPNFWSFIFLCLVISLIIWNISNSQEYVIITKKSVKPSKKMLYLLSIVFIIPVLILIINLFCSPLFQSSAYYKRITVADGDFTKDVLPVDFNQLALLDKDSSNKLGDKVMGQMTDLVSQYEVSELYTQINYNNEIVRVTPLEYANIIKYFTNRKQGVVGYITVNSVTGESQLSRLDKGMKYMPSAIFFENLERQLRIQYPTTIFGDINFELDDDGNPYWIVETIKYAGVGLRKEVTGVIIFDPITASSTKYKSQDVPKWVDHVYSSELVMQQLDNWGMYKNGFFNSIFGQKDVTRTTSGYNYLAMNDDIYMYTGITSVSNDASNIGFVLTNLRTKETHFYNVAGAMETAAMASAEGQVQQMKYTSTFPLLINLNNKPTYLVSLKDNAGLVKMYAFIDYVDYQKVVVTDAADGIEKAAENYLGGNISTELKETEITISDISAGNINGTTYYYLKSKEDIYKVALTVNEQILPFLKVGDKIKIEYQPDTINEIIKIK